MCSRSLLYIFIIFNSVLNVCNVYYVCKMYVTVDMGRRHGGKCKVSDWCEERHFQKFRRPFFLRNRRIAYCLAPSYHLCLSNVASPLSTHSFPIFVSIKHVIDLLTAISMSNTLLIQFVTSPEFRLNSQCHNILTYSSISIHWSSSGPSASPHSLRACPSPSLRS